MNTIKEELKSLTSTEKKKNILAFDVSNNSCSVAISKGNDILAYQEDLRPSMQAENLLPLIEKALDFARLDYANIDYLAFTNGPGSFTGIRIGLATAEGILIASNIKHVVISNFEMAFYRLKSQMKSFDKALILLNAYRGQLYYQKFDKNNHGNYGIIDIINIIDLFQEYKTEQIICGGTGVSDIYEQIRNLANITILPRFPYIKAMHICKYAYEKITKNDFGNVEPLYIRPPDAKQK